MEYNQNRDFVQLCIDTRRGRVKTFANGMEDKVDEIARTKLDEIFGVREDEPISDRAWKHHKDEWYEVIEDVVNVTVPDAWQNSDFYNELVESKSGNLGQKNEFIIQDNSTLIVSRFSGNHWDIDRQKLPAGKTFSVDTEWIAIMIYDETERFRKGIINLAQFFDTIQRSVQREIDDRIYSAFNGAGTYLPTEFQHTGTFVEDKLLEIAERVSVESGRNVRIAGSRSALSKIYKGMNTDYLSGAMKDDINTTGYLNFWKGYRTIAIPQSFKRGTYDFKNPDDMVYVFPENYKPIKLFFEGNTRSRELDEYQNHDQTISYQLQTKLGVGVVFDSMFGTYKIV